MLSLKIKKSCIKIKVVLKYEEQGVLEDGDSHHSDDTHRTGYYAGNSQLHVKRRKRPRGVNPL